MLQNLTSSGVVLCVCRHGESCCRRPRIPGDGFLGLSFLDALALTLVKGAFIGAQQNTGACAHLYNRLRAAVTCAMESVGERESLVPDYERVMALARGARRVRPSADTLCSATPSWTVARAQLHPFRAVFE